jgi:hypothetical protein
MQEDLKGWTIDVLSRQLHETPSLRLVSNTVTITMPSVYACVLTLLEGKVQIKLYAIFQ